MKRLRSTFGLILCIVIAQITAKQIAYDEYKVYRLIPTNYSHLNYLKNLQNNPVYQFWTDVTVYGKPVDVMVAPAHQKDFENDIEKLAIQREVFIENVQELIDLQQLGDSPGEMDWKRYHNLSEINNWLLKLPELYPDNVELVVGGVSYENTDILGVHVRFNSDNTTKSVFIESNIHACEWIGSAVSTYILNELLTSQNETVRKLANSYNWYFFPVFNPDGFRYTQTTDRLWRKNRVPHGKCVGADPNRNWDHHFNEAGTSNDPCAANYAGPFPFSEPETKSLSEYLKTIGPQLAGYISFHSYSQILLLPYGYTSDHLDNYDQLYEIGLKGLEKLSNRYGTEYKIGNVAEILYPASGGSPDWVKGTFKTKITYTYELRDTGKYGFLLPPDQIIPTAQETFDSLITIFEEFAKDDEKK